MSRLIPSLALSLLASVVVVGCDAPTTSAPLPLYVPVVVEGGATFSGGHGSPPDASDAPHARDAGHDATLEAGRVPDTGVDVAHAPDAPPVDASHDSAVDSPLDSSRDAHVVDASGGGGHDAHEAAAPVDSGAATCSVDAGTCAPVCMHVGTATEGWYQTNGTMVCEIACSGLTAMCERVGTSSQGWYTTTGHGCPPHATEILNDSHCQ